MDPQRLARRAGSFTLLLFFALSSNNSHASLSRGHPSKDVRVYSGTAEINVGADPVPQHESVESFSRTPPVKLESMPLAAEMEIDDAMDEVTEPLRVAFAGGPTFGPKALGKILRGEPAIPSHRSAGGYLPETGSLSLRFAAPRRWPDPLLPPVEEMAGPEVIFVLPPIAVHEPVTLEDEQVAIESEADEETVAQASAETHSAIADMIATEAKRSRAGLTADMVVSSLNVLLHRGGDTPARFEPAIIADPVAGILPDSIQ